jgi:hypothetical protein
MRKGVKGTRILHTVWVIFHIEYMDLIIMGLFFEHDAKPFMYIGKKHWIQEEREKSLLK